jgi:hypothetical protein
MAFPEIIAENRAALRQESAHRLICQNGAIKVAEQPRPATAKAVPVSITRKQAYGSPDIDTRRLLDSGHFHRCAPGHQ